MSPLGEITVRSILFSCFSFFRFAPAAFEGLVQAGFSDHRLFEGAGIEIDIIR
jgi:hypothetical protein